MNSLTNAILISGVLSLSSLSVFADTGKSVPAQIDRAQKVEAKKETTIQDIRQSVIPNLLRSTQGTVEHRVGNGGEELEIDLKKRSLQIAYFLGSTMGKKTFSMLNSEALIAVVNSMDIDVTSNDVFDRYNTPRTCINEPERKLITCNDQKIVNLLKKEDILTATLFHEILGLMELELGYQDNVSMYPVSSKILPYHNVVVSTPITEGQVRPEFYGLDHRSYGVTVVNKKTKESIRLICINDNVEVHRCRNYTLVRKVNGMQAPLVPKNVSISQDDIAKLPFQKTNEAEIAETIKKLKDIQSQGFKFISWSSETRHCGYRFGIGMIQGMSIQFPSKTGDGRFDCFVGQGIVMGIMALGVPLALDVTTEAFKQTVNATYYPIKAVISKLRIWKLKRKLKKLNNKLSIASEVVNFKNDLSLVGTTRSVSDEDYKIVLSILSSALMKP